MKVTTDGCLFGAWAAAVLDSRYLIADNGYITNGQPSTSFGHRPTANDPLSTFNFQLPNALDIGTGTGLLTLMLAQKTQAVIDAIEIDPAAAAQATQNMAASPWANRLQVMEGDITQIKLDKQYPVIISNPPFFENQLASPHKGKQMALHASALSLQQLLASMASLLLPQGIIFLLLPAYREAELKALVAQHGWYINQLVWVKQTPAHAPFRMMIQLSSNPAATLVSTITIKETNQQYSQDFVALLKDYYLHL